MQNNDPARITKELYPHKSGVGWIFEDFLSFDSFSFAHQSFFL